MSEIPRRVVTLIHGTKFFFAADPKWIQDDHPLPNALRALEGAVLHSFPWSGRNRHGDRLLAAKQLKDHLTRLIADHPEASHHIVAHSHGGNVALHALHGDQALERVQVATMGTPFLAMRARAFSRPLLVFFLLLFLYALAIGPSMLISEGGWPNDAKSRYLVVLFGAIVGTVVATVLILGRSMLLYRRGGTQTRLSELVSGKTRLKANSRVASGKKHPNANQSDPASVHQVGTALSKDMGQISSPKLAEERLLVVGAQGDEAAGVLGAAQLTSWVLAHSLWGRSTLRRFLLLAAVVGVFVVGATLMGVDSITEFDSLGGEIALVGGLVMLVTSTLLVISYLPFGTDLLFWTLHADITAGPLPKGYQRAFQAVSQRDGGLAHSVYDDPEVIEEIVSWIRQWDA